MNSIAKKVILTSLVFVGLSNATKASTNGINVVLSANQYEAIAHIAVTDSSEGPVSAVADISFELRGFTDAKLNKPREAYAALSPGNYTDFGELISTYAYVSWNGGSDSDSW